MYVDDEGQTAAAFNRNLLGLVFLRTSAPADGRKRRNHLGSLRALRAHLLTLGRDVPVYGLSTEQPARLDLWRANQDISLRGEPYNLIALDVD